MFQQQKKYNCEASPPPQIDTKSDGSELHLPEQHLQQINSELSSFIYAVSHDIKGPLKTLETHLNLLHREYILQLDPTGQQLLTNSIGLMSRVNQLMQDVLNYAEPMQRAMHWELISTQALVTEVIANLSLQHPQALEAIEIETLPDIIGETTLLSHLFTQLIQNALTYQSSTRPPQIYIGSQSKPHSWIFFVRDNGIGIDAKYHDRIFQLFQRLHSQAEIPGSGLGLSLCQKAISFLNGSIWLESQINQGSTFYFEIPRRVIS